MRIDIGRKTTKLPTGIIGFDLLLRDGLKLPPADESLKNRNGLIVLIKGKPGSGKTTMALQLMLGLAESFQKKCDLHKRDWKLVYCSFEQAKENIQPRMKSLAASTVFDVEFHDGEPQEDLTTLICVLDGLNVIPSTQHVNPNFKLNVTPQGLAKLRTRSYISILVYEPTDNTEKFLEYSADLVIEMKVDVGYGDVEYSLHKLSITKSRYQEAVLGWHQYKIRDYGVVVFPSVHFHVHHFNYMEEQLKDSIEKPMSVYIKTAAKTLNKSQPSPYPSVLEYILAGVNPGSFTVILGPRGTFKSTLTIDFLAMGAKCGEPGLLYSLIDNRLTLERSFHCPCQELDMLKAQRCLECHEKMFLFHQRPGCIASGEFFHYLRRRLTHSESDKKPVPTIKRLAFWDLTQLDYRFPLLAHDPMFLPTMMDFLKKRDTSKDAVSAIMMGSGNAKLSKVAAATADNVVFCWRDILKNPDGEKSDVVALYVDRSEGALGNEGKSLHTIKVDENGSIKLPDCEMRADPFKMAEAVKKCEEMNLKNARAIISRITSMQGYEPNKSL